MKPITVFSRSSTVSHTHRVLIVEDDYAFRWSLAMRCQRRHIDADVADNVPEADDLLKRSSDYCGVLIDLRMRKGDSTPLLDTIASREHRPTVVVVTGYPDIWERVSTTADNVALVSSTIVKPA